MNKYILAVICLILPLTAQAQTPLTSGASGPIEVTAAGQMIWDSTGNSVTATENVIVTTDEMILNADKVTANTNEVNGKTDITSLTATGSEVTLDGRDASKPWNLRGATKAVFDRSANLITFTGGMLILTQGTMTVTAQQKLTYNTLMKQAVALGKARVSDQGQTLQADQITAVLGEGQGAELQQVTALGNVIINTPDGTALAERGTYNAGAQLATLEGNVRITRGQNQMNGAKAEVNLATGQSRMLGSDTPGAGRRLRALIIPSSEETTP